MQNMKISTRLIALIVGLIAVFAASTYLLIQSATQNVYNERYDAMRTQVDMAVSVMKDYYAQETSGTLTHEEAFSRAAEVISNMTYEPNGYIFGYDYEGTRRIMPGGAGVGKNYIDFKDKHGNNLIANLIAAGRAGGGTVDYYWPKPGGDEDVAFLKTSYAQVFEPWQMMLGTGTYMDDIQTKVQSIVISAIIQGAIAMLLAIGAALVIVRSITKPLSDIHQSLGAVANEDTELKIPHTGLTNEIGLMAKATEALQEKVRERHAMEERDAENRRMLDSERDNTQRMQEEEASVQSHVVATLNDALKALSDGDLTVRCEDLGPRYAELRQSFNTSLEKLEAAMKTVTSKGTEINASKDEITRASGQLATRTEQQAASLEAVSAALDELTVTVRQTSEGANEAATRVANVNTEANRSDEIVGKAINAMSSIETSSNEISQIIGVIDEIAFQTNLLALNAGVEAARAGESGKGFAVVAQEVRELAQRSANAAKEIKEKISQSSEQVTQGVNLVGSAGEALRHISAQIQEANAIVANIAQSAREQDTTLSSISGSVNQLDSATQQNAAMAEETTAAAAMLATETEELLRLIGNFRVEGTATGYTQSQRAA